MQSPRSRYWPSAAAGALLLAVFALAPVDPAGAAEAERTEAPEEPLGLVYPRTGAAWTPEGWSPSVGVRLLRSHRHHGWLVEAHVAPWLSYQAAGTQSLLAGLAAGYFAGDRRVGWLAGLVEVGPDHVAAGVAASLPVRPGGRELLHVDLRYQRILWKDEVQLPDAHLVRMGLLWRIRLPDG